MGFWVLSFPDSAILSMCQWVLVVVGWSLDIFKDASEMFEQVVVRLLGGTNAGFGKFRWRRVTVPSKAVEEKSQVAGTQQSDSHCSSTPCDSLLAYSSRGRANNSRKHGFKQAGKDGRPLLVARC